MVGRRGGPQSTDWPGVVDTALEMMVAGGIIEPEPEP